MGPDNYEFDMRKLTTENLLTEATAHSNLVKVFEEFSIGLMNSFSLTGCHTYHLFALFLDFRNGFYPWLYR